MNKLFYSSTFLVLALVLSSCGAPATATEELAMTMDVPTEAVVEVATEAPTDAVEVSGPAPLEGNVSIDIAGSKFSESSVTIRVGTTVTWTNKDDRKHTVTSDDSAAFDGTLSDGATFSFTFTEAGEFPYHCDIHRSMKAKIIVVE